MYEYLQRFLSNREIYCKNEIKCRKFVEGVLYVAKTGCGWRQLPPEYGKWNSVWRRFNRFSDGNIWNKIFDKLKSKNEEIVAIDSTSVRVHQEGMGYIKNSKLEQKIGKSRGGFTTKSHAVCDALGNSLDFIITGGKVADCTQFEELIEGLKAEIVLADRGYNSNVTVKTIEKQGAEH